MTKRHSDTFADRYHDLIDLGATHPQIAERLGLDREYLMRKLGRHGIEPRFENGSERLAMERLRPIIARGDTFTSFDLPFAVDVQSGLLVLGWLTTSGRIRRAGTKPGHAGGNRVRVYQPVTQELDAAA